MFDRTRWSALGAAVAVTLAAGFGLRSAGATETDGGGAGTVFVPVVPCRLFDTRPASNVGPRTTPLGPADTHTQQVTGTNGNCTIPAGATGVALNVTVADPTAVSYLTLYPADASRPNASNLNWQAGAPPTPNKVDVKLSADGRLNLYNNGGTVNVLADIVGYYADHDHDDRYYTKAQIDAAIGDGVEQVVYGRETLHDPVGHIPGSIAACVNFGPTEVAANVPLAIPVGSRLISVDVAVYDKAGGGVYELSLDSAQVLANTVQVAGVAGTTGGDAANAVVHHVLTPATPTVAAPGMSFALTYFQESDYSGFCNATLTYDRTP